MSRPRKKAVYLKPQDAWGLSVWQQQAPEELILQSLAFYDTFYATVEQVCVDLEHQAKNFPLSLT